ncbi:Flp pilus assembly protein CpaB [Caulobacter segnis]|uniref:Flp pilus assembly protein CpaB n=1 Tax=Caulobacter segnis TaxID=88688 RepID=UPI002410997A|nr:Flp pilus assembly protein CpaB [Caulobacter segnis]MDG2520725.1 Flp pilus assembly protein CpaB [Caulobacter segnis]
MRPQAVGRLLIGFGAVLGVTLIAFGLWRVLNPSESPVQTAAPKHQLVVAAKPIARGSVLSPADLRVSDADTAPPADALPSPSAAGGQLASMDIPQGATVTRAMLTPIQTAPLALQVPQGLRAISLDADVEAGVARRIAPGDRVDVQAVLADRVFGGMGSGPDAGRAVTLMTNVLILAVGEAGAADQGVGARAVTLALSPEQVPDFMLARSLGKVFLALRRPGDQDMVTPVSTLASLTGVSAPRAPAATPVAVRAPARPRPAAMPVEVVLDGRSMLQMPSEGAR